MKIKKATVDDSEQIAELSGQLGYASEIKDIAKRLEEILSKENHIIRVAYEDGKVLGWIHAFETYRVESDTFIEIGGLVVDKEHRKKGIGKNLVDSILEWSSERRAKKIRVRCTVLRKESHLFYESIGFTLNKTQKVYDRELSI